MDKRIRLTRAESHAQTRERLLVAARQVVARHGFGGASVDMIAAEAGYSKGAIYSNFDTKEAILLERYAEEQIRDFKTIMKLDPSAARDAIKLWLDTMNADVDWDVVTMELQLHARRNRVLRSAFTRWKNGSPNSVPKSSPNGSLRRDANLRSIRAPFRTLACGLNLKIPRSMPGRANEAGRIIHELLDLMLEPHRVSSDSLGRRRRARAGSTGIAQNPKNNLLSLLS